MQDVTLEKLADDYAERTASEVMKVVGAFCTRPKVGKDVELFAKIVLATKGIVADKALQKTAHVLKVRYLTNVVAILRDPAHMIRIACKDPLHRTGRFEQQYNRLFGERHSVIKAGG